MAVIDSLEIDIQSKADSVNTSLNNLVKQLGLIAEGISAIGKNSGLENFAKKAQEAVKEFSSIQNAAKGISNSITPEMQKVSKSLEEITAKYKDLGKNFKFVGSTAAIQKQIDSYSNALEKAKLKKQELEAGGKTSGQGYEDTIKDVLKYENVIESLKNQLAEMQKVEPQLNFNISGIEEAGKAVEEVGERIRESVMLPESAFNYDAGAMSAVFGEAAGNIKNWAQAVEIFGANAGRVMNESAQLNFNISGIEEAQQNGGLANQSWIKTIGVVAGEAMSSLRQKLGEIPGAVSQAVGNIPIIGRVAKEAAFLGKTAFEGFKSALSGIAKAASAAVSAVSKIASGISKLASGIKGAISKLSSMAKSFIGLKGASKGMNTSLGGGLKTILKYGLGIRSLYTLINKLRTAMKEGFKNLAQYSDETNASISMLQSSLGALKNSLATAFAPILNVVAPYLSAFIDMLTRAFNAIGQFFSALTGKTFAAQAVKNFSDYAAGVSEAGSAAKEAGEDVQKGVRAFDELNVITTQDNSSGNSGSTEISPTDMFTTVPIESDISDFAQKIKDAWANADFTEIGTILGTKLKAALDGINWEPIKETAAKIGKSIGTLINGFVEVDGLADSIGRTIGEAINTGISGINSFLDNTHWDSVGTFIGEGLNGVVNTIDWEGLGHLFAAKWNAIFEVIGNIATTFDWSNFGLQLATSINTFITDFDWAENGARLGELAKGLLDSIISFLENTDWQALGNGIADFIGGVDWGGILERLAEGIGAALGGLAALLWGLIEDAWNSVVEWWQETAFEDGQFTITGLLNGIWEGVKNIGTWIVEHIFTPFIDGFKKAFGIASPSKVMVEQGGFIMQGLLDGINSLVQSVIDVFNKIKEKIVEVWGAIKTKTSDVWTGIKTFVSNVWTGLKTNVSNVFGNIKTTITNAWNGIKTVTTNVWNGIKTAVKTPINAIIGFVNGMVSGVASGLNSMINAINKLEFTLPDWVPIVGEKSLGFSIPNITVPQIPYLAKGGLVTQYTPAVIGESGMEAVLPLTNKRTMSMIADSIFENVNYTNGYRYSGGFGSDNGKTEELIREIQQQNKLLEEQNEILTKLNKNAIVLDDKKFLDKYRSAATDYHRRTGRELGLSY